VARITDNELSGEFRFAWIAVPLPKQFNDCGGRVIPDSTLPQFQQDTFRQTIVRRFDVETAIALVAANTFRGGTRCRTSDALGAAHVQVGPQPLTVATHRIKQMGISHERAAQVLERGWGLRVSRSAL
jgi:hypothetical protein